MITVDDLPGLFEVEIGNDRIISLKGRCKAADFKKVLGRALQKPKFVEVDDDDVCDC
jgi:hypothetical protein